MENLYNLKPVVDMFPSINVAYIYQNELEELRVKNIKDLIYLINTVEFKRI